MEIAKIHVTGTYARIVSRRPIPEGLIGGYITVEYRDPVWQDLTKTVVFKGAVTRDVVTEDRTVTIPAETIAAGKRMLVGFYGTRAEGILAIPTFWADLGAVMAATDPSGDESTDPSLPVWAELTQRVEDLEKNGGGSGGNVDLTGVVKSVNGQTPDENGNVPLTAANIGALPNTGGDLTGELRMNGQPISGLNAPMANDHAANMGFVNQQMKKAAPRNLLDNSDFRNPVNQRGYTRYTSESKPETNADPNTCYGITQGTTIDRFSIWSEAGNTSVTVHKGYMTFSASYHGTLYQRFEKGFLDSSKSYTLVVKKPNEPPIFAYPASINYEWSVADTITLDDLTNGNSVSFEWAALYEGEYTIDTLPEYQPKGYGAELAECQRYYLPILNEWVNGTTFEGEGFNIRIVAPAEMRSINVTIENSSIEVYKGGVWHETSIQWTVHRGGGMYDIVCAIPEAFATGTSYIARGLIALNAEL